jgi:hypothetical protein
LKNFNRFWVNYSHHTTNLTTERMALLWFRLTQQFGTAI